MNEATSELIIWIMSVTMVGTLAIWAYKKLTAYAMREFVIPSSQNTFHIRPSQFLIGPFKFSGLVQVSEDFEGLSFKLPLIPSRKIPFAKMGHIQISKDKKQGVWVEIHLNDSIQNVLKFMIREEEKFQFPHLLSYSPPYLPEEDLGWSIPKNTPQAPQQDPYTKKESSLRQKLSWIFFVIVLLRVVRELLV